MELSVQLHTAAALPSGKELCYHWLGGWVGPRAGLYTVVSRKVTSPPLPGIEPPRFFILQPSHYTD
jgi:hypothetical protein